MEKIKTFFKKYPWVYHLILMVAVSVVLLFLISLFVKCYGRHGKEFEMPQFELTDSTPGMTVDEAMSDDNGLELEFVVDTIPFNPQDHITKNPHFRPGVILSQDPKAGSMIKKGRKVYVRVVAAKAEEVVMPELVGHSVRHAVSEIERLGLTVGTITYVDDPFKNNVKEQRANGRIVYEGDKVPFGTTISLMVGNGYESDGTLVPLLIAKTPDQAHRAIYDRSLNVGREHWDGVTDRASAVVYRQEPDYNGVDKYPFGTTIELWYKNATEAEKKSMIDDFRIDSSRIISQQEFQDIPDIEDLLDDEVW